MQTNTKKRQKHVLSTDNVVFICKSCNSSKGNKRLYELFELDNMYGVPRIAEGKYLKLLYSLHAANGTLNISDVSKLSSVRLGKQASREGETTCLLFGRYVEKLKRICDKARLRVLG